MRNTILILQKFAFILYCLLPQFLNASNAVNPELRSHFSQMWVDSVKIQPDTHAAFRGILFLQQPTEIDLQLSGSSWYVLWLNGEYFFEGPDRYHPAHPEYQVKRVSLPAGKHNLAVQVHYEGVDTRMLKDIQPFLMVRAVNQVKQIIPIDWKCSYLPGYDSQFRRISAQLGWVEWADSRLIPDGWQKPGYNLSLIHI